MMRAAHRQHRGARRKTLVEDIDLGIGVTPELQGEQCQQHRLARAGRANNEHVADVTDMGREPERGRSARLGIEQGRRSEEHTSELQSLMRISYAVFCLKKKKKT